MVKEDFKVTPWDVEGNIDYDRLIKHFGLTDMISLIEIDCFLPFKRIVNKLR